MGNFSHGIEGLTGHPARPVTFDRLSAVRIEFATAARKGGTFVFPRRWPSMRLRQCAALCLAQPSVIAMTNSATFASAFPYSPRLISGFVGAAKALVIATTERYEKKKSSIHLRVSVNALGLRIPILSRTSEQ